MKLNILANNNAFSFDLNNSEIIGFYEHFFSILFRFYEFLLLIKKKILIFHINFLNFFLKDHFD